jgi:hypothetical protein
MKFTPEEDLLLNRFVIQSGRVNWNLACAVLPNRTARQCRERWMKYLCPTNSFEPFTSEEDTLLRQLFAQFGPKWTKISRSFKNRTDITLKNRWLLIMRRNRRAQESETSQRSEDLWAKLESAPPDYVELFPVANWRFTPRDDERWPEF